MNTLLVFFNVKDIYYILTMITYIHFLNCV